MSGFAESAAGDAPRPATPGFGRLVQLLGVAPVVAFAVVSLAAFIAGFNPGSLAFDLRGAYLPAADAVLHLESPYPPVEGPALASQTAYVYPPLLAFSLVPLTLVAETVAAVIGALLAGALLVATLAVLGVRDWRCYGAMLLWAPTVNAIHMASSSALLAFAAALAWRYRASTWPLAGSIALAVATKMIVWPLLVWTVAMRRLRAAAVAAVLAGGVTLAAWAALSFDGLARYPAMLRRLAELEAADSYSLVGAWSALGLSDTAARLAALAVAVALLGACVVAARRGDDLGSFALALAASLAFSPIVWLHYLVLVLVPLAVARPRFSTVWLLPLLLWATPLNGNGDAIQPLLPAFVAAAVVGLALVGRGPRGALAAAR